MQWLQLSYLVMVMINTVSPHPLKPLKMLKLWPQNVGCCASKWKLSLEQRYLWHGEIFMLCHCTWLQKTQDPALDRGVGGGRQSREQNDDHLSIGYKC